MKLTKEELEELERADEQIETEMAAEAAKDNEEQRFRRCTAKGPMSKSLKYYYAHREYFRQRYYDHRAENLMRSRAYSAKYYAEHREQEREKAHAYYLAHVEEAREYRRRYRDEHREELIQKQRARRAALKAELEVKEA